MKTLDDMIADLATRGELVHLSIVSVAGGFSATFAPASAVGSYSTERDKDPVKALKRAIENAKGMKRRSPAKNAKPGAEPVAADDLDFG